MPTRANHPAPWLLAAWPGMGNVAVIAAAYLIQKLGMKEAASLPSAPHFDVNEVLAKDGVFVPVRLPRGTFFRWTNPADGRDLLVFLAEAQPTHGMAAYAEAILDEAQRMGVARVATFASMATALHPAGSPRVTCVATDPRVLDELRRAEVEPMKEGQLGGMNGVLPALAANRGLAGFCLLAEIPFFAAMVANPKAARAALSVFCVLAGIEISLDELDKHAAVVDEALKEAYEQLQEQGVIAEGESETPENESEPQPESSGPPPTPREHAPIDDAARARIESLFEHAKRDRSKAVALKQELDRLGVFKNYENRFLDLFRQAG